MKKFRMAGLLLALLTLPLAASAGIGLRFERTGATAAGVTVRAVDADGRDLRGVSASLESSHAFKTSGAAVTPALLCPDVNGNASPTISLRLTLSGLPAGFSFTQMALDIHALNGAGAYQQNNDGKKRQFNVAVGCGSSAGALAAFGRLDDIDIADGVGEAGAVHRWWTLESATPAGGSTLVVDLTVTRGTQNEGCFFGLAGITLGGDGEITPGGDGDDDEFPRAGACYHIKWLGNASMLITEEADGTLVVSGADVTQRQYWQFEPTGRDHCYYIRSAATGRYIQSSNLTPSSASRVSTGAAPVEYYLALGASGATAGHYRLTSTDCADYDNTDASPRGLNKDGASQHVIVWHAGPSNTGSYWDLAETENTYELRPFSPSPRLGSPLYKYALVSASGRVLERAADGRLGWAEPGRAGEQAWYFVRGEGHDKGWLMADAASHEPLGGTRWHVLASASGEAYYLRPYDRRDEAGTALAVEGDSLVTFRLLRSDFALRAQIYDLPCGSQSDIYLLRATLEGEAALTPMVYPLPTASGGSLGAASAARPGSWHTLYTDCPARLRPGAGAEAAFTLSAGALPSGLQAWLYFDWDRDGLFEETLPLEPGRRMTARFAVPADAVPGSSRMRLRLTENGLEGADDEVVGQIVDFAIEVSRPGAGPRISVRPNDPARGRATLLGAEGDAVRTAVAEPLGDADFVCWKEGRRIVGLDARHDIECTRDVELTAVFSPNTDPNTGIAPTVAAGTIEITGDGRTLTVKAQAPVLSVSVYSPDGRLAARADGATVGVGALPRGCYVVRAVTAAERASIKVAVR